MEGDTETDIRVLVENNLLHNTSRVYRLHNLTHEFLVQVKRMQSEHLREAISRQTSFLIKCGTLRAYAQDLDGNNGGLYSLVKLWRTLKDVDPSGGAWEHEEYFLRNPWMATVNKPYMGWAGEFLQIMVRNMSPRASRRELAGLRG